MKKIMLVVTIAFALNTSAQASTCLDLYRERKEHNALTKVGEGSAEAGAVGTGLGMLAGSKELMIAALPFIALGGAIILVQDFRYNRMIKLIEEANAHAKSNGSIPAGKHLKRFYNRVTNDEFSVLDLAYMIKAANEKGDLCIEGKPTFYHEAKRNMILMDL